MLLSSASPAIVTFNIVACRVASQCQARRLLSSGLYILFIFGRKSLGRLVRFALEDPPGPFFPAARVLRLRLPSASFAPESIAEQSSSHRVSQRDRGRHGQTTLAF